VWSSKDNSREAHGSKGGSFQFEMFLVRNFDSGHKNGFLESDILLTLNGNFVRPSPHLDVMYNHDFLEAVIMRKREKNMIKVFTVVTEDLKTDRVVILCGAMLHPPLQAVRQQISNIHSDMYVSSFAYGSPAHIYGVSISTYP
jgi:hypothetical protein